MKRDRRLMKHCFGTNEWNFADLPGKISNVRLARLLHLFFGNRYLYAYGWDAAPCKPKKENDSWRFHRHRQSRLN